MTSLESLRNVLELECKKGYTDKAVIGGLDKYLHRQAGQIRQELCDPELLVSFDELGLANSCYSSYSPEERKRWLTKVLEWLNQWEGNGARDSFKVKIPERAPALKSKSATHKLGDLDSPITIIKGITPRVANKFARLNVRTIRDLLYFFPRRYVDYTQTKLIRELVEGEEQTIVGTVWQARVATLGNRPGTEAIIGDATGNVRVVWFNQPYLAKSLPTNASVAISGVVTVFKGQKVFESPEWELLKEGELIHTGRLVPIYPLTEGLYARQVRKWTKEAVDCYAWQLKDFLPQDVKERCQLLDLSVAIEQIHYPDDQTMAGRARMRVAFDELFLLQLGLLLKKRDWQESQPGNAFHVDQATIDRFLDCLPFTLTGAQQRVLAEILADLQRPKAMSRLLQGDVGSGKTVIATLALLVAAANDFQAALMAPTEVLAEQHYHTICRYLSQTSVGKPDPGREKLIRSYPGFMPRPVSIALLTGGLRNADKERLRTEIKEGKIDIVIGTHALIQNEVEFKKLGLAVIDEQHRFGVLQRSSLRQKGFNPHLLAMTATPIPRTMALTLYGDLDISIIDELPPGRQVVRTTCVEPEHRQKAYQFLRRQVSNGHQAFIICPLIEESEVLQARAATAEFERLSRQVFPDLRLGLLHGQMSSREKDEVIERFRSGDIDILVSTSVVEVGIDVPKASVILIEGAERFGLAQLHQLRGRVGRDKEQGYCILVSEKASPEARERLRLMEKIHDGFALAEKDLELRGPGEFFGTHQSGLPNLRIARLSDLPALEIARREAMRIFRDDPCLAKPEHMPLRQQLSQLWLKEAEWS